MPLQDHFHPPLSLRHHWHAFHNAWATYLAADLNRQLPKGYFAEANVQFGIEIDVAALDEHQGDNANGLQDSNGWSPPGPTQTIPMTLATDIVEIRVFSTQEGPILAGTVELVSPANKDRSAHRDAFVSKCAAYLQQGLGLVIVDVVTERRANLHEELLQRVSSAPLTKTESNLYAAAYRPVQNNGETTLDIWLEALAVGQNLPIMPLWLPGAMCLQVDLEATYQRTCLEQRVTFSEE